MDNSQSIQEIASKGGKARASALTAEERSQLARQAAEARWERRGSQAQDPKKGQDLPKATHTGELRIGEIVLPCAVLDDGTRVLSERDMSKALGRGRGGKTYSYRRALAPGAPPLPVFISGARLEPFIPNSLSLALRQPIIYRGRDGGIGHGVAATLLVEICDVWIEAQKAGALLPTQEHIAARAEILMRGLAGVAIIALVDDATGYTAIRDREELHRILEAYINKELLPWSKTFPDEYYQQLFRLRGWRYSPPSVKRPQLVGKLTHDLIYKKLPRGVIEELKQRNPVNERGYRRHKHFQFLTEDIGEPHLKEQLVAVTTLMRAAPTWGFFKRLMDKAFSQIEGAQAESNFDTDEEELAT